MATAAHWHVLGPGSVGCLWAARLLEAGHPVRLIGRPGTPPQRAPLRLETGGETLGFEVELADAPRSGEIRQLLVATKAHQTLAALAPCLPLLAPDATLLLLQNGMGVQQAAVERLAPHAVFCGVSTEGAFLRGPLHAVHAGRGLTRIGALAPQHAPRLDGLLQALAGISLAIEAEPDIQARLWEKLAINCAINPLTALHRCRNGALAEQPALWAEVVALCGEIAQVLRAEGLPALAGGLEARVLEVVRGTAANYSSMYQDAAAGRTTEIEFITGHLLAVAGRHGLALPANARLYARIRALEAS